MTQYTITLADGRQITGLSKNGSNFVSENKIDESIFENNLSIMKVFDGETEEIFTDMIFIQQMEWFDGTFYLAFREKTQNEKMLELLNSNTDGVTDIQIALVELYEMILGGVQDG